MILKRARNANVYFGESLWISCKTTNASSWYVSKEPQGTLKDLFVSSLLWNDT